MVGTFAVAHVCMHAQSAEKDFVGFVFLEFVVVAARLFVKIV
jgi:hypothetical protein